MSLFVQMNLTCPNCEAVVSFDAVGSVNADRRPDYRDEIIDNTFQIATCGECEHEFRLEPDFNYLDAGRGQWIAALPPSDLRDHLEIADEKRDLFDISYGPKAPAAAQTVGAGLKMRVVFGWPAMREKLVLAELGFDDVIMEIAKLDLLRNLPSAPMSEGVELRLVAVNGDRLVFVWIEAESEDELDQFEVERSLYDSIADNPDPWQAVRDQIDDGPFVDIQKLFMGEGRPGQAA